MDIKFEIEKVDRFWYFHNRNHKTYKEITFWYSPTSFERRETERVWATDWNCQRPTWAENITEHNNSLEHMYY